MADEQSHYDKYDKRTNQKMAEHNRSGGDVRKPVRSVEGASAKDKRDRARFAFRKASQALTAGHPLKDEQGRPTPAAMQFKRWAFKVPQNREDLQRLKAYGEKHMKKPEDMEKAFGGGKAPVSHTLPSGAVVTHRYYHEGHTDNPEGHSFTLDVTNPAGNATTRLELRHHPEHNAPGEYDALASARKVDGVPMSTSNRGKFGGQVMKELRTHLGEHLPQVKQVVWRNSNDKLRETPVQKSWVDAADNKPTSQWTVKPFRTLRPQRGVEHAHISAPGNRGAIMSYKHNPKTGHTEILNFRAYTYHNDAFKAGSEAMARGVPMQDVDNIMEFHRSNVGVIGPAGVRAAARYLKETVGSKTVGGLRVSGTRMNNENDLKRAPTRRQGDLESLPGVKVKRELTKAIADRQPKITEAYRTSHPLRGGETLESLAVNVVHPETNHAIRVSLTSMPGSPQGHWHLDDVEPIDHEGNTAPNSYSREHVGKMGAGTIRHIARHLQKQYGVKNIVGLRVTGVKAPPPSSDVDAPIVQRKLGKAIDYEALDEEFDPKPKKAGKGGKGSPVGSRADQQRHQEPALHATHNRIAALKPKGVSAAEWKTGVKHESEHENVAPSKVDQAKIAAVHLKEEPHYYAKLKRAGIK